MRFILVAACLLAAPCVPAQARSTPLPQLSVETIFGPAALAAGPGPIRWSYDGESYLVLERSAAEGGGSDIVRYVSKSGAREVLVSATELALPGTTKPIAMDDFQLSAEGAFLLLKSNSQQFRRTRALGDFWLFDTVRRTLRKVGGDAPAASLMYAELSPDGRSVAYVRDANLHVEPTSGLSPPRRLTTDGSDTIVNGIGDWVNEEEFGLDKAYRWSPDSQRIAFWRFDVSNVGTFHMIDNDVRPYPQTVSIRYPKVGTANAAVRVGSVDIATGRTAWVRLEGDPTQNYVPQMSWTTRSDALLLQYSNRLQNRYAVMTADVSTGAATVLFVEQDAAWVDQNPNPIWIRHGDAFLWLSDRDGWKHLYVVSRDGKRHELRTPGEFDVVAISAVDEARGWVYFIASPDNPTQRYLYRARLNGQPRIERVTEAGRAGWNHYTLSPGARWAMENSSTRDTPPVVRLIDLSIRKSVRTIEDNRPLAELLAANPVPATEFLRVDAGSGVQLDAWLMKPAGFDPKKKYPVLFYVYGEPFGVRVTDVWSGQRSLWHRMLAQQGYIVASIDPRGTPQPRGRAWRKSAYRQVGILASSDLAASVQRLLADRPYMDPERVGIWGWSGGGAMTLNAMFRYPELFKTGIAVAAPTDQLLYDTIYQERYMGLPEDNQEGYRDGSPITFARNLTGNLLLIHGTGDDNVHYQHLEQLVDRLIAAKKHFTMMAYPQRRHEIDEGENTSVHLYSLMTRYLDDNLKRAHHGQ